MAKNENSARIISGCKKGDSECFSQLVEMYANRCYGYFYRLTGDKDVSDDLLSELFVRLVEKIDSYMGGSFESWLFKIASNLFYDHLRQKQHQRKLLNNRQKELESNQTQAKQYDDERIDKLQTQLGKLDVETRELIMLRFYSQLSFKQIAKMRSEPIGTVLSKVHRGLKKLRQMMND